MVRKTQWMTEGMGVMLLLLLASPPLEAQERVALGETDRREEAQNPMADWPFGVGETLEYGVRMGRFQIGEGKLRVEKKTRLRGHVAYHVSMHLKGGPPFYRVDDYQASWIALQPFRSLQFLQKLQEGDYSRHRKYVLKHRQDSFYRYDWQESKQRFRPVFEKTGGSGPMPDAALDELSYLYLLRTLDLQVGTTYYSSRYFEQHENPIEFRVLERKNIRVPQGHFDVFVVQPVIPSATIFEEDKEARIYITTDKRRLIVMLESATRVGTLQLYLTNYRSSETTTHGR